MGKDGDRTEGFSRTKSTFTAKVKGPPKQKKITRKLPGDWGLAERYFPVT